MRRTRSSRRARPASRRRAWSLATVVALLVGCGAAPERPANLLFISIDTLRADHLGAYGYERPASPHLDRLADEGVLFEQFVSESSWTLPAHLTMLTGLRSQIHGVHRDRRTLPPEYVTLAEVLRDAGYRTTGIVSAPYLHPIYGGAQGFDEYLVLGDADPEGPEFTFAQFDEPGGLERYVETLRASHRTQLADDVADEVVQRLGTAGDQPFFLFVHIFDVHYDYIPPEEHWRPFDPDYDGSFDPRDFEANVEVGPDMPPEELRHLIALYDGEVHWTDAQIGRMLDALAANGLADDTLVVATSDHGEELGPTSIKGRLE